MSREYSFKLNEREVDLSRFFFNLYMIFSHALERPFLAWIIDGCDRFFVRLTSAFLVENLVLFLNKITIT